MNRRAISEKRSEKMKMEEVSLVFSLQCHKVRHPVVFIIKLVWSVCICLTQLYAGRDMYRIYYITNNYIFQHLTLAIFRLRNKKLSKQLHSNYVGCIQWGGKR